MKVQQDFTYTNAQLAAWRLQLPKGTNGRSYVRRLAGIRDNNTCQMCGKVWDKKSKRFHSHHLQGLCGRRIQKCDKIKDLPLLVTLCASCHTKHHEYNAKETIGKRGPDKKPRKKKAKVL